MVVVHDGEATLAWDGSASDRPFLACDPAARHLIIWGRRPEGKGRTISRLHPAQLARLQVLLSGY